MPPLSTSAIFLAVGRCSAISLRSKSRSGFACFSNQTLSALNQKHGRRVADDGDVCISAPVHEHGARQLPL